MPQALAAGWETIDVAGTLHAERFYRNVDGRQIIGLGGAQEMEHDAFNGTWAGGTRMPLGASEIGRCLAPSLDAHT